MPKSYKRDSIFAELPKFDYFAKEHDFLEVTHWYNGEGFDVMLSTQSGEQRFSLSWGEWKALTSLVPNDDPETLQAALDAFWSEAFNDEPLDSHRRMAAALNVLTTPAS